MLFRPEKWSSSNVKKNRPFAKGLVHRFCQKFDHFLINFFFQKPKMKHFLIFWIENKVFGTSKVKFSESRKKTTFCKGVSPLFLSKNRPFSYMFFFFEPKKAEKNIFWYSGEKRMVFRPQKISSKKL